MWSTATRPAGAGTPPAGQSAKFPSRRQLWFSLQSEGEKRWCACRRRHRHSATGALGLRPLVQPSRSPTRRGGLGIGLSLVSAGRDAAALSRRRARPGGGQREGLMGADAAGAGAAAAPASASRQARDDRAPPGRYCCRGQQRRAAMLAERWHHWPRVEVAADGEAALGSAARGARRVLIDIGLPGMDGTSCARLRRATRGRPPCWWRYRYAGGGGAGARRGFAPLVKPGELDAGGSWAASRFDGRRLGAEVREGTQGGAGAVRRGEGDRTKVKRRRAPGALPGAAPEGGIRGWAMANGGAALARTGEPRATWARMAAGRGRRRETSRRGGSPERAPG